MTEFRNDKLLSALKEADSILLCSHVSPDGDTIGSVLALAFMLEDMGKKVTCACADPVPGSLHFLPCWEMFVRPEDIEGMKFDCAVAVDAADEGRLGPLAKPFRKAPVQLQIDHHGTNPGYAMENEVDAKASATGCIIWRLMKAFGCEITEEYAEALYVAINSDTGNFCFENTNEECFECMTDLMKSGLKLNIIARNLNLLREVPHLRLLGRALGTLNISADGRIAGMMLRKHDYIDCDAPREYNSKIVNYAMDIPGVEMAYLADETDEGTKFSLRAQPPRNVAVIATEFGGGGHILAAGCRIRGKMIDEAAEMIEHRMQEQLE